MTVETYVASDGRAATPAQALLYPPPIVGRTKVRPTTNCACEESSHRKSLRNDRPPPTVPNALSIVVVDACPADYMATLAASRLGVRWQFLGCGRKALRMASVQAVDLWVVNVSLPDMSGLELCRMLHKQPTGPRFPHCRPVQHERTSGLPAFSALPCSPASRVEERSNSTGTISASRWKAACFTRAARLSQPTQITKPRKIIQVERR